MSTDQDTHKYFVIWFEPFWSGADRFDLKCSVRSRNMKLLFAIHKLTHLCLDRGRIVTIVNSGMKMCLFIKGVYNSI